MRSLRRFVNRWKWRLLDIWEDNRFILVNLRRSTLYRTMQGFLLITFLFIVNKFLPFLPVSVTFILITAAACVIIFVLHFFVFSLMFVFTDFIPQPRAHRRIRQRQGERPEMLRFYMRTFRQNLPLIFFFLGVITVANCIWVLLVFLYSPEMIPL